MLTLIGSFYLLVKTTARLLPKHIPASTKLPEKLEEISSYIFSKTIDAKRLCLGYKGKTIEALAIGLRRDAERVRVEAEVLD